MQIKEGSNILIENKSSDYFIEQLLLSNTTGIRGRRNFSHVKSNIHFMEGL